MPPYSSEPSPTSRVIGAGTPPDILARLRTEVRRAIDGEDPHVTLLICRFFAELGQNLKLFAKYKAIRAGKTADKQIPALVALGFSEAAAQQAIAPDAPQAGEPEA
mgnify:CR=1 FL=1